MSVSCASRRRCRSRPHRSRWGPLRVGVEVEEIWGVRRGPVQRPGDRRRPSGVASPSGRRRHVVVRAIWSRGRCWRRSSCRRPRCAIRRWRSTPGPPLWAIRLERSVPLAVAGAADFGVFGGRFDFVPPAPLGSGSPPASAPIRLPALRCRPGDHDADPGAGDHVVVAEETSDVDAFGAVLHRTRPDSGGSDAVDLGRCSRCRA